MNFRDYILEETSGVLSVMDLHGYRGPTKREKIKYQTEKEMERIVGTPLFIAPNGVVTSERELALNTERQGTGTDWRQPGPRPVLKGISIYPLSRIVLSQEEEYY